MNKAILIHNATAGDADHEKEDLTEIIKRAGYSIDYYSTSNPFWERFTQKDTDVIFLAGGDGTVHKFAKAILETGDQNLLKRPVHILPYGTANNIGLTLNIAKEIGSLPTNFENNTTKFDFGWLRGLRGKKFFLEGIGFGIFPELVLNLKEQGEKNETANEELYRIRKSLLQTAKDFKAQKAEIIIDGMKITGEFLLVEIMNIRYIGPNFELAPKADPGDAFLDLVLIPVERRQELVAHLQEVVGGGRKQTFLKDFVQNLRVQNAEMKWAGKAFHIDDEVVDDYSGEKLTVSLEPGKFQFIQQD